jgi:hypothetical protein
MLSPIKKKEVMEKEEQDKMREIKRTEWKRENKMKKIIRAALDFLNSHIILSVR